jgi:3-deoxy-manno-octulosonate cytidylyltransferase (CMP-KDO synthetase)
VAIVPARLASTRLARKMLLRESGRFLFEHTVHGVRRSRLVRDVYLATDSEEIQAAARAVGIEALLTPPELPSGTDRVHAALTLLLERALGPWDVVLNVQGDEPELQGECLDPLVQAFASPEIELATLCTPLGPAEDAQDPSIVKVVLDRRGDALYFSRAPIPARAPQADPSTPPLTLRHIGVYAFRPRALRRFCALPRGRLEQHEGLEQLRWLEAGERMRVLESPHGSVGIDTAEQYARFVARQRRTMALGKEA